MHDFDLTPRPYHQLVHAMLRQDGSDPEIERTDKVMEWVLNTKPTLEKVTTVDEIRLIDHILEHWSTHKTSPTRETLDTTVRINTKPKALLDLLEAYDKDEMDLKEITHADMSFHLQLRVEDYDQTSLKRALETASQITVGGIPNPKGTPNKPLPELRGPKDAIEYIQTRLERGVLAKHDRVADGFVIDHLAILMGIFEAGEARRNGQLTIPTGIPLIEAHMGGLRRKELTGVLGFVGQRKTAVVRTMAYAAAAAGFTVLHIPVESDYKEESLTYCIMHAHVLAAKANRKSTITNRKVADGLLNLEEAGELQLAVRDFSATIGTKLLIRQPVKKSWGSVKSMIVLESDRHCLDLVIVDYMTLLTEGLNQFELVGGMTSAIQEAKALTMSLNNGKGVAFVTPIQGNRKGYEDATENDGAWQTSGIFQYSELDKSLDNCLYVYTTPELAAAGQIKMGSCKHRRGADIPSTFVPINVAAGMLVSVAAGILVSDKKDVVIRMPEKVRPENERPIAIPERKKEPGVWFPFLKAK
jgi:hypothetical protein